MQFTRSGSILGGVLLVLGLVFAAGCGDQTTAPDDGSSSTATSDAPRTAGLALTADVLGDTDIGGMRFLVSRVPCAAEPVPPDVYDETADFEDLYLPGGIPAFERKPYDENSQHIFADQFFWLPAGCYNVSVQPLNQQGNPSQDCFSAHKNGVQVQDAETTEIHLISQCIGPARGALDVLASVNHPPTIERLEYRPSKFVSTCRGVQICATASDPDDDPIEFKWEKVGGGPLAAGPNVASTNVNPDGSITQCALIRTGAKDKYDFQLTAWDLAYDENENIVHIEDLLAAQGDAHESRDEAHFPLYAGVDCPIRGRTVTMLLTLGNHPGPSLTQARRMARNSVNWVNPTINPDPEILVVRDDNHHNEQAFDTIYVVGRLHAAGFTNVTYMNEPNSGLQPADVAGYDVVWFSNPGWPMDDVDTYNTLMDFIGDGGGLVLQGDDMTQFQGGLLDMTPFTHLTTINNGTTTCGRPTDNNTGFNYRVQFGPGPHPLITGLENQSFLYGNDIDHASALATGEAVVASARLAGVPQCPVNTPTVVGFDPGAI